MGWGFPGGAVIKNPPANAGDTRDKGLTPGARRSPRVAKTITVLQNNYPPIKTNKII